MSNFGFHTIFREKEKSDIEETLGFEFVEKDNEPYPMNVGKPSAVHLGNATIYGIYRGVNEKNHLVLFPFVQTESFPDGKREYYWERNRPTEVEYGAVMGMSPARLEYLDELVKMSRNSEETFSDGAGI